MLQSIEKRENVLREALEQNEKEVEQWKSFVEENETAINNMNTFSKMLTIDVMVPFGKKAFFPGKIIHTNEVLVAHYEGYFSECSTYVATEICKQRIENGKKQLIQLEAEKDLFQNKLEKPYLDGVLPNMNEREIIEDYDEESEKIWREQHRQRVKEAKLKEKKEREEIMCKSDERDLFQSLEDDERSISELNEELIELENEYTNETTELLNKLISGEISLPPSKKRIAHGSIVKHHDTIKLDTSNIKNDYPLGVTSERSSETYENIADLVDGDDDNESETSVSEIPEEIRLIVEQAGYLPENDRYGFYQYQIQIAHQKLSNRTFSNSKELEEKLHLIKVREHLEELLEETLTLEESESEPDVQAEAEEIVDKNSINIRKRKISFAMENQMLEFRKNETVAQMLPNTAPKEIIPTRDIIRLDEPTPTEEQSLENGEQNVNERLDKRKTILEKVEENLKNNNLEDADLVNKIIGSSTNHIQTLHIHFKHSSISGSNLDESTNIETPRTPADFHSLFSKIEPNVVNTNADNNFYLKESDRERAYIDVRSEFLTPCSKVIEDTQSKSILKNKGAVQRETHAQEKEEKPKIQTKKPGTKKEEECLSAYNTAVGDVIENPTEPDLLPEVRFVDMHAPKKRISRFKQMRTEKQ